MSKISSAFNKGLWQIVAEKWQNKEMSVDEIDAAEQVGGKSTYNRAFFVCLFLIKH